MKRLKLILVSLFAVAVLAALYFYIVFRINNQETKIMNAAARVNASGQFIQLTDGLTHYESGGIDTGKTIILVHGFSVPYHIWNGTYDSLVQQGFHVIRYDEFGRGFSDRPDVTYNPAFYRKQLFDLISALKLRTPLNLMCVSFGGAVVTDFTVHYPQLIDKIILIDPVYAFTKKDEPEMITNYKMAVKHEKQAVGQLEDFKYPERFPDWVDKYKVQMQYKGFRHALISTINDYPGDTILANYRSLNSLHKKILLIWGKEDRTVPFQFSDSLRKIVQVDFFPVDDAGHLPYLEQPVSVNRKIISFLKE
jgi:pimeloyl-ACP methyl ester carboxylesterase